MTEPITEHLTILQGAVFTFALYLTDTDIDGTVTALDTSAYTAEFTVRQTDYDGAVQLSVTDADYITLGFTPTKVLRNTAYTLGQTRIPDGGPNGFIYKVTTAGTSHAVTIPTYPTTLALTVTDGTVVWTAVANDDTLMNLYIYIPDGVTEALTDWGKGVYSLNLIDSFGHTERLYQGICRLSREATY